MQKHFHNCLKTMAVLSLPALWNGRRLQVTHTHLHLILKNQFSQISIPVITPRTGIPLFKQQSQRSKGWFPYSPLASMFFPDFKVNSGRRTKYTDIQWCLLFCKYCMQILGECRWKSINRGISMYRIPVVPVSFRKIGFLQHGKPRYYYYSKDKTTKKPAALLWPRDSHPLSGDRMHRHIEASKLLLRFTSLHFWQRGL